MATLKRSHNETSMKNKYDALKELEKGGPDDMVFELPKRKHPFERGLVKGLSTINAYFRKEK